MNTPPAISLDSTVRQTSNQLAADMGDGEMAMLSIDSGQYFHLNETSSRIWELIEAPICVREICETLKAEFDIDDEQCEAEVLALVTRLVRTEMAETVAETTIGEAA